MPRQSINVFYKLLCCFRPFDWIVSLQLLDAILFLILLRQLQLFLALRFLSHHKLKSCGRSISSNPSIEFLKATSDPFCDLLVLGFVVFTGILQELIVGLILKVSKLIVLKR